MGRGTSGVQQLEILVQASFWEHRVRACSTDARYLMKRLLWKGGELTPFWHHLLCRNSTPENTRTIASQKVVVTGSCNQIAAQVIVLTGIRLLKSRTWLVCQCRRV